MPNTIAYLVLYSWPLVVVVLFWKLPLSRALVASILGGYLFLPDSGGLDLPILPPINKELVPSLSAAVMCLFMAGRAAPTLPRPQPPTPAAPRRGDGHALPPPPPRPPPCPCWSAPTAGG